MDSNTGNVVRRGIEQFGQFTIALNNIAKALNNVAESGKYGNYSESDINMEKLDNLKEIT